MMTMCTLCIPPSKAASMQVLPGDIKKNFKHNECKNICRTGNWMNEELYYIKT